MVAGSKVKELRRARGMRVEDLCAVAGVSLGTVRSIESGNDAQLGTLRKIADALGVAVVELIREEAS